MDTTRKSNLTLFISFYLLRFDSYISHMSMGLKQSKSEYFHDSDIAIDCCGYRLELAYSWIDRVDESPISGFQVKLENEGAVKIPSLRIRFWMLLLLQGC